MISMYKRLLISLALGALLGVVCILGAQSRYNGTLGSAYLFAFWFNRVIIGLTIGLISWDAPLIKRLIRGFILGLVVSFAFYSSTDFLDLAGFLVGGVYGVVIELVLYFLSKSGKVDEASRNKHV